VPREDADAKYANFWSLVERFTRSLESRAETGALLDASSALFVHGVLVTCKKLFVGFRPHPPARVAQRLQREPPTFILTKQLFETPSSSKIC